MFKNLRNNISLNKRAKIIANLVDNKTLLLSLGMERSGSTLLFNILRLICNQQSKAVCSSWIGDFRNIFEKSDIYVIKSHKLYPQLLSDKTKLFYTFRDIRDVIVSLQKLGSEVTYEKIKIMLKEYEKAKTFNALMIKYEDFVGNKDMWIQKIADKLLFDIEISKIKANLPKVEKVSKKGFETVNPITQMHQGHGTFVKKNEWKDRVDSKLIDKIYKKYDWWFIENQYEL